MGARTSVAPIGCTLTPVVGMLWGDQLPRGGASPAGFKGGMVSAGAGRVPAGCRLSQARLGEVRVDGDDLAGSQLVTLAGLDALFEVVAGAAGESFMHARPGRRGGAGGAEDRPHLGAGAARRVAMADFLATVVNVFGPDGAGEKSR